MITIKNKKVVYFADIMLSVNYQTLEEEFEGLIAPKLKNNGIQFEKVHCVESPPFKGAMDFDILFFDWGGMTIGNSLLEHFCRYIIEDAPNYPNRCYVISSQFTEWAMNDALREHNEIDNIPNIFLTITRFCEFYKEFHAKQS